MIDQTVARRYARALLDVALDQSTADAIKGELSEIRKQIEGEGGFKSIIAAGVTMPNLQSTLELAAFAKSCGADLLHPARRAGDEPPGGLHQIVEDEIRRNG